MTYKVNGTEITTQPTSGRWLGRDKLGINGFGHPVYPAVREFEMTFVLHSPADANQLQTYFNQVSNTGTVVVDLPQYGAATYTFFPYTGCIIHEPEWGEYFAEYQTSCKLLISNIKT